MIAGVYNITCQQGSTFSRLLEIEQPDLEADPTGQTYEPYDLNGYSARMQVRRTIESSTVMVYLTTENSGLTINPTGETINHIRIYMSDDVTASIGSSGVYDLEIINGDGEVSRVIQGAFTLSPEVTR
jgi:hypothetical protein